jgi:xanthine dehydrogenase YagR molybdenum-binding subunit
MKFDTPATTNPIDQLKVVGQPIDRIDGPLKTTGTAPYAYERTTRPEPGLRLCGRRGHRQGPHRLHRPRGSQGAPGVLAIVTAENAGKLGKGKFNTAKLLGGPEIEHYHQAVALVVAETFEQARAAAQLVRVDYDAPRAPRSAAIRRPRARPSPSPGFGGRRHQGRRFRRAPSPRRRCSSTPPTPRPTSRTR